MILWFWDGYIKYAICILAISLASIVENLYETITNINTIRKMVSYECVVEAKRKPNFIDITSGNLVPGDVIVVPENCMMPCDLLLLSGSCVVNESMLTGESVPVTKYCI